jgi:transposase
MAMPCENAVVQAPAPDRPIDGGMATEALLAQVLIGKYWRTERRLSVKQR